MTIIKKANTYTSEQISRYNFEVEKELQATNQRLNRKDNVHATRPLVEIGLTCRDCTYYGTVGRCYDLPFPLLDHDDLCYNFVLDLNQTTDFQLF